MQLIRERGWYTIQVDKSTDVENKAIVVVFEPYIFWGDFHDDMLCALLLPPNTIAAELFKSLNDYISGKLN